MTCVIFATLQRALAYANQRKHEYATLEHLLLALTEDVDASLAMKAWNIDLGVLSGKLIDYLDTGLKKLVTDSHEEAKPTPAFHRVIQRATVHAQEARVSFLTGPDALLSILAETLSPAAKLLEEQGKTYEAALKHFWRPNRKPNT